VLRTALNCPVHMQLQHWPGHVVVVAPSRTSVLFSSTWCVIRQYQSSCRHEVERRRVAEWVVMGGGWLVLAHVYGAIRGQRGPLSLRLATTQSFHLSTGSSTVQYFVQYP